MPRNGTIAAINFAGLTMLALATAIGLGTWGYARTARGQAPVTLFVDDSASAAVPDLGTKALSVATNSALTGVLMLVANAIISWVKSNNDKAVRIAEGEQRLKAAVAEAVAFAGESQRAEVERLRIDSEVQAARRKVERDWEQRLATVMECRIRDLADQVASHGQLVEATRAGMNRNTVAVEAVAGAVGVPIEPSTPVEVLARAEPPINPSLPRLLIIENDAGARRAMGRLLRMRGWDVTLLGSAVEICTHVNSAAAPFGAYAIDLMLGGVTGADLIRLIRGVWPTIPSTGRPPRIVAWTGCEPGDPNLIDAIAAGVDAIQTKPCEDTQLEAVLLGGSGNVPIDRH